MYNVLHILYYLVRYFLEHLDQLNISLDTQKHLSSLQRNEAICSTE